MLCRSSRRCSARHHWSEAGDGSAVAVSGWCTSSGPSRKQSSFSSKFCASSVVEGIKQERSDLLQVGRRLPAYLAFGFFEQADAKTKKACRGRRCGRLSKRTEQRLGGGVPLFLETDLGGGEACLDSKRCGRRCIASMCLCLSLVTKDFYCICCTAPMQNSLSKLSQSCPLSRP